MLKKSALESLNHSIQLNIKESLFLLISSRKLQKLQNLLVKHFIVNYHQQDQVLVLKNKNKTTFIQAIIWI